MSKKKKVLIIGGPILAFLIIVPLATYIYYYNDISDQDRLMNRNNTGIVLYDSGGTEIYDVGRAAHHKLLPLNKISDHMQHALVASEDKKFYKNNGFSITGIFRAFFQNLTSGSIKGGGSTITQQLAKNTLLSSNQTFLRKYQELTVAIAIDQHYSKDQILDMYLNSVFFGGTNFGVEEAAKFYFNTTPDKLSLAQSAMLVGVLPAPNAYSPTLGSMKYAKQRQKTVLNRMVEEGYISQDEADKAYDQKLKYVKPKDPTSESKAPFFVQMVLDNLYNKYGQEKVLRSGFQVKTTLNLKMQKQAQANIDEHIPYIEAAGGSNASAMAMEPGSGAVRVLIGSADYDNKKFGKVNMVTTPRQPGSSFKTIYYTGALANGTITPATILKDRPTTFPGNYKPLDADRQWRGDVTTRQAISQSLNVPSVEVMQKYGIDESVAQAKKLGISSLKTPESYGLALALGAAEAPLEEMTGAYSALANGGTYYEPRLVDEVKDKFDKVIQHETPVGTRAVDEGAAYLISDILSDQSARAPIFGQSLSVSGHDSVAVKTGTTDDSRDAWTIGYTPKIAFGVWVGNNDNTVMANGGSDMAGPIWRNSMASFLDGSQDVSFTAPDSVVKKSVCYGSGKIAANSGSNTYSEYFLRLHIPDGNCNATKKVTKISVCDLSKKSMVMIDKDDFTSNKYSKDPADCEKKVTDDEPKTIDVCDTTSGQIVTIKEDEFDSAKYSRDTANCEAATVKVCDTSTNQIVTINESDFDGTRYSRDLSKCQPDDTSDGGNE